MTDQPEKTDRTGLNPAVRSRTDTSRDTETPSRPPAESASVQREEGKGWPAIWLIVTVLGVLVVLALFLL